MSSKKSKDLNGVDNLNEMFMELAKGENKGPVKDSKKNKKQETS